MSVYCCSYIHFVISGEHMEKGLWNCWHQEVDILTAATFSEYLVTRMYTVQECFHLWWNFDKCTGHCKCIELCIICFFTYVMFTANDEFFKVSWTVFSLQELSYLGTACSEHLLWKYIFSTDKAEMYMMYQPTGSKYLPHSVCNETLEWCNRWSLRQV
jgi:hypothetical protein